MNEEFQVVEVAPLGQVTSGKKRWSDGTLVAGQQFEYGFDDIGNRDWTKAGQEAGSGQSHRADYANNPRNQITQREAAGFLGVSGVAEEDATVTVNLAATARKGEYWWGEAPAANSGGPVWLAVTNIAVLDQGASPDRVATNIGHALVPATPEVFGYDADGNLASDSLWTNVWDAENRRTVVESRTAIPAAARMKEQWTFLSDGRWIERIVSTNSGSAYVPAFTNRYVWDGNVLLAILDSQSSIIQSFARGLDLSGSHQGAGGVGGLLWVSAGTNGTHFACFDGNGNVMALVDASTGAESARYEYGPFSEDIRATGPMARINSLRFSTQYADDITGDCKYLHRDLDAATGRWPTPDPIGERGGVNLYGFVGNNPITESDAQGLCKIKIRCGPVKRLGVTIGWYCGVVAPNGVEYGLGGGDTSSGSSGTAIPYPTDPNQPPGPVNPDPPARDYPVTCGDKCTSCDSIQKCLQNYHDTVTPPSYNMFGPNSNTYAHNMLSTCGCSVDPIPQPCYTVYRSPKEGGPITICPGPSTSPPGATGW
jgi:RHS repeat-associated protein